MGFYKKKEKNNAVPEFKIALKKQKAWYIWGIERVFLLLLVWVAIHVGLNVTAYQEIAEFRIENAKTTIAEMQSVQEAHQCKT